MILLFFGTVFSVKSQENLATFVPKIGEKYTIEKNDGTFFTGEIISFDAREVLIETKDLGQIIIPKHEVKSIRKVEAANFDAKGNFIHEERFATRYFLTTNGLPIKKGEHYANMNWWGPDFEFAVSDNFGLGVMTSWVGIPVIGTAKYTIKLADNFSMAIGGLAGSFTWASIRSGFVLPYISLTGGNRRTNITLTGGYGLVFIADESSDGRMLISLAGMHKVSPKFSLVFDSFIAPAFDNDSFGFSILMPGVRYQSNPRNAFQFGFGGVMADGDVLPVPIPMLQWFFKIN